MLNIYVIITSARTSLIIKPPDCNLKLCSDEKKNAYYSVLHDIIIWKMVDFFLLFLNLWENASQSNGMEWNVMHDLCDLWISRHLISLKQQTHDSKRKKKGKRQIIMKPKVINKISKTQTNLFRINVRNHWN